MRLRKNSTAFLVSGVLAMSVPLLFAQQNNSSQAAAQPSGSAASANQRAADLLDTINTGEIQTAKVMEGKTQNSDVKDFASMLSSDHQDAQSKLQSVADQSSLSLQSDASMRRQGDRLNSQLQSDSDTAADRAYVQAEARDHRTAIRELNRLEPNVTDPQLKDYIQSDVMPMLQKHLAAAQKLEGQLGVSASSKAGAGSQP